MKVGPIDEETARAVDALVDEYRARCLWWMRQDFYPRTVTERMRALDAIQRLGDVEGFRRAGALRRKMLARGYLKMR